MFVEEESVYVKKRDLLEIIGRLSEVSKEMHRLIYILEGM